MSLLADTLAWPFFTDAHRAFADRLSRWAEETLQMLPHDYFDAA
jgi:acyl-CoA dehydrogenase